MGGKLNKKRAVIQTLQETFALGETLREADGERMCTLWLIILEPRCDIYSATHDLGDMTAPPSTESCGILHICGRAKRVFTDRAALLVSGGSCRRGEGFFLTM